MMNSQAELPRPVYARKYFCTRSTKSWGQMKRKFSLDETHVKDFKTKYLPHTNPVCVAINRKEKGLHDRRNGRRLSECKVYYPRENSQDSASEDSTSSIDRHNSITSLGYQITAIIGLSQQVRLQCNQQTKSLGRAVPCSSYSWLTN